MGRDARLMRFSPTLAVCVKAYRDTTADERAVMTMVLENALRALPPAPEGWVLAGDDRPYVQPSICRDDEGRPWRYELSRDYQRVDDLDKRNKILEDASARRATAMQAKQPRLDAIMARIEEISAAAGRLARGKRTTLPGLSRSISSSSRPQRRWNESCRRAAPWSSSMWRARRSAGI